MRGCRGPSFVRYSALGAVPSRAVDKDDADAKRATGRRGALKALAVFGGAAATVAVAAPGVRLLIAPVKSGGGGAGNWVKTIRQDALREGDPKRVAIIADHHDAWELEKAVELGAVWLIKRGDAIDCFSVVCPHLGCSVVSVPGGGPAAQFNCSCHNSDFDASGTCKSGPSPRALDRLDTKIDPDGYVLVDFRRYRQGTPDKIEMG